MSKGRVTYGQVLGTNSRNGDIAMGTTCSIATGFSKGKYGYKQSHFLGANITGTVGGKNIIVASNIYF